MNGNRDQQRGGSGPRQGVGQQSGRGQLQGSGSLPEETDPWVREVIEKGNYRRLDEKAREIGEGLGDATKTQIRVIFGTVKKLEALKNQQELLQRELTMLRPRLVYTAAREKGLEKLRDVLLEASAIVREDAANRTQRLVDFMEAVLCYSYAASSKKGASR